MGNGDSVKVSVIMLTYNHKDYIRQAIESVLEQDVDFDYELIIGDDASDDGTTKIVQEYVSSHPQIVKAHIRKMNIGATLNLAGLLNVAKGEYVASCEGDDYWTSRNKLQIQIDFLDAHPEFIGCTHNIDIVDNNNSVLTDEKSNWIEEGKKFTFNDFDGFRLPGHAVSMVYRNIFKTSEIISPIPKLHWLIADRTIAAILLLHGNICKLDYKMAAYRFVRINGGKGATNYLCDRNDHFFQEYRYTKRLEKYLSDELGHDIYYLSTRRHFIREHWRNPICA